MLLWFVDFLLETALIQALQKRFFARAGAPGCAVNDEKWFRMLIAIEELRVIY